jgi:hypothetical protein
MRHAFSGTNQPPQKAKKILLSEVQKCPQLQDTFAEKSVTLDRIFELGKEQKNHEQKHVHNHLRILQKAI